jgi:hypothetical protein
VAGVRLIAKVAAMADPTARQGGIVDKPKTKKRVIRAKAPVAPGRAPLEVKVVRAGTEAATLEELSAALMNHPSVRKTLGRSRHRVLSLEPMERVAEKGGRRLAAAAAPAVGHRATIYDYTKNRTLVVEAALDRRRPLKVVESGRQPPPTMAEFDEAVQLLGKDPELGAALREHKPARGHGTRSSA